MRHHGKRRMRAFARRMATPAGLKSDPPSTPEGDCSLHTRAFSASPNWKPAPPPSSVPVAGLPMLLQSWAATQDANAAVATVPTPTCPLKRSAYFRQIGEDVETHAATIHELKEAIAAFQSMDMAELARFHHVVERQLVWLTDETQGLRFLPSSPVLARFDTLKGWKLAEPILQQLDRVEVYFNKIKDDVDMIERNEDEEMKRFQCHKSQHPLRLGRAWSGSRRAMVDLSSN
ncbi:hypothetical protein ACP70R_049966 [Stipagrostis hirtigluma subsp. patula]